MVVSKDDDYEYTIQRVGQSSKLKCRVHIDRLASFQSIDEEIAAREAANQELARPLTLPRSREKEYEVEEILDHRGTFIGGDREYLVKWQGYEQPDWEPDSNLTHCPQSIEAYELKLSGVVAAVDCDFTGVGSHWPGSRAPFVVGTNVGTIQMDLSKGDSAEQVLKEICESCWGSTQWRTQRKA